MGEVGFVCRPSICDKVNVDDDDTLYEIGGFYFVKHYVSFIEFKFRLR